MLSVEQVTFRYDRRSQPVLRNASLSLDAGQVGVLLGRNGCGKTTLLQFGGLQVYDAVMAGRVARFGIQPGADDRAAVDAALEDMELTALAQRNVQQLSGGERQKVAIARALAQEPRLLVFDEPTGNLDVANEQRILRHARRLARTRGITVLCTLHDLNQALQCGDRLFLMQDGCIKYTGGGDILTPETVQEIFGARVRAAVIDGKKYLIGADDDEE